MKRISQSKIELETHLREHLDFLNRSAFYYDEGAISEAKRIATSIRVLLHNTEKSHSLLDQLNMKGISFLNTAAKHNSVNKDFFYGLCNVEISFDENMVMVGKCKPFLSNTPKGLICKKLLFPNWWNQVVIADSKGNTFKRRELVLALANTDGGAHVDPKLDARYRALSRENSLGFSVATNGVSTPILGFELAAARQIAYELICSIKDRHPEYLGNV